jgi:Ca2+-binding RTX toxin-like protein
MPTLTFTSGNDSYEVTAAGTFDLTFLAGDDVLTTRHAGAITTASMGDGNDVVYHRGGTATVTGGAGADRFEVYASGLTADGGDDNDLFNVRGGSGQSLTGGLGDDRFNFYGAAAALLIHGGDGDDDFFGYYHSVTGDLYGDAGNDYFITFVAGVSLHGGTGNDIYRADAVSPAAFVELAGEGTDSVQVARGASYTLPDNIENISVQGFSGSVLTAATLTGNALNNTIVAHNNDEIIFGLDGNDNLNAKGGSDTLYGGNGNDILDGGTGNDTLQGDAGNDTLQGRSGDDAMAGGTGDDLYYVDSLSDVVVEASGEGVDLVRVSITGYTLAVNVENGIIQSGVGGLTLTGNALGNVLTGNAGNDTLIGGDGNDTLNGGAGNDTLWAGDGNDTIFGGAGNDTLNGIGGGNDLMYGGTGDDVYSCSPTDSIIELAGQGIDTVHIFGTGYTLASNVENGIVVTGFGSYLSGNSLANILTGDGGLINSDDHLYGYAGNDTLYGQAGDDVLDGGTGDDTMNGGSGDDIYYLDSAGDLIDESGGDGWDTVYESFSEYTLGADIENGVIELAAGATLTGNELSNSLTGGAGGDVLYGLGSVDLMGGGAGDDTLYGGDGDDSLSGGDDSDTLYGGAGTDFLDGGLGDDIMIGGTGNDTYIVDSAGDSIDETGGDGVDTVYESLSSYTLAAGFEQGFISLATDGTLHGNADNNLLHGGTANDQIDGLGGNDILYGDIGADTLSGGDGNDALNGDGGIDSLYGGLGDDTLYGGDGNDALTGGYGNDTLHGGLGADTLWGGEDAADIFKYDGATDSTTSSFDTIQDFFTGVDKIDLSAIDANTTVVGDQAFTYSVFSTGVAGQIWWVPAGGGHYTVFADVDGGGADFQIDVVTSGLASGDFVF